MGVWAIAFVAALCAEALLSFLDVPGRVHAWAPMAVMGAVGVLLGLVEADPPSD